MATGHRLLRQSMHVVGGAGIVLAMIGGAAIATDAASDARTDVQLAQAPTPLTVFVGPVVFSDSVWMADANGFYKEEGLEVTLRPFPSGSTALETFKTGEGDIVLNGELPSVRYWAASNQDYRLLFIVERDSRNQIAMASNEIKSAEDLEGKTIGTRVGSTGSWFISEYLTKHGVDEAAVTIKNLDTQVLPTALCGGEIDAFFIWQPFGSRTLDICPDKVHLLTTADGYVHGYNLAAARPGWLADPANRDAAIRFMRATLKGKAVAEKDFAAVAQYVEAKFGMSEQAAREGWEVMERPIAFDQVFYDDYCKLTGWMRDRGMLDKPFNFAEFLWLDGLKELQPDAVTTPPGSC